MAKIDNGILGAFSGRVGPVVGLVCNGRAIMRSAPTEIRNPRTAQQQAGRGVFAAASRLACAMREVLEVGLRGAGAALQMSARNLFIRLNRGCFGSDGVDYSRVRVADGALAGVAFGAVEREGLQVAVSWGNGGEGGKASDYVYLYAYAPRLSKGMLSLPALRREGRVVLTLPSWLGDEEVQLYGFVWDRDAVCSPSVWLGSVPQAQACDTGQGLPDMGRVAIPEDNTSLLKENAT